MRIRERRRRGKKVRGREVTAGFYNTEAKLHCCNFPAVMVLYQVYRKLLIFPSNANIFTGL